MNSSGINLLDKMINDNINLYDFTGDANFDQFIDLIPGENEKDNPNSNFDSDLIIINSNNLFDHNQFANSTTSEGLFGNFDAMVRDYNPNALVINSTMPRNFDEEIMLADDHDRIEENDNGENSSRMTIATTIKTATPITMPVELKVDREKTLVSERNRRDRMKEKLYALRSLIPNITKMDKASIVGDALLYVQGMQMQAKKLKAKIAELEASLEEAQRYQVSTGNPKMDQTNQYLVPKTITQMEMFEVEERGFYAKVECKKGEGVAISLYMALESLTNFNIHSYNLQTVSESYIFTFTLNVKECEKDNINLLNLKLWVTGAFVNQGFEISTTFSA